MIEHVKRYIADSAVLPVMHDLGALAIRGMATAIAITIYDFWRHLRRIEMELKEFKRFVSESQQTRVPSNRGQCIMSNFLNTTFTLSSTLPRGTYNPMNFSVKELADMNRAVIARSMERCRVIESILKIVAVPRILKTICCVSVETISSLNRSAHPFGLLWDQEYIRHGLEYCQDDETKFVLAFNIFNRYKDMNRGEISRFVGVRLSHC